MHISPNQNARLFAEKLEYYLLHGVRLVWVVDPESDAVDVYIPGRQTRTLRTGDTLDGGGVLPGFRVPVADILAQLQV